MRIFLFCSWWQCHLCHWSELSQESSRWQQESDAPGPHITEVQILMCLLTCTWHVLSHTVAHSQGGGNRGSLWSGVKGKMLHFFTGLLGVSSHPKGCHFLVCEWVAVGCGLSHSGPGVDVQGCDGPCLRIQTREEDMQPWGQRALWSRIPKLLQHCLQPWPKYQIQSCKHCFYNITLPIIRINVVSQKILHLRLW